MKILTDEQIETLRREARREGYAECLWRYRPMQHHARDEYEETEERARYRAAAVQRYPA